MLVIIFLVSAFITIEEGTRYIGADYFEDGNFVYNYEEFIDQLGSIELTELDGEKLKEKINVSQQQIDEHRYRYGSLSEQIENIQSQYNQRIIDAEASNNETIKNILIKERDTKIADIQKNFEDDSYVAEKVKVEIEREIDTYIEEVNRGKLDFQDKYGDYSYELTNIETGKIFSLGNISENAAFTKVYNEELGYLKISTNMYMDNYSSGVLKNSAPTLFEGTIILPERAVGNFESYQEFQRQKRISYISIVIGIVSLVTILFLFKFQKSWFLESSFRKRFEAIAIDIRLFLLIINIMLISVLFLFLTGFTYSYVHREYYELFSLNLFELVIITFLVWLLMYQCVWMFDEVKQGADFISKIKKGALAKRVNSITGIFSKVSIGIQVLFTLVIVFFWGLGTALAIVYGDELVVLFFICSIFIGIPSVVLMLIKTGYLNQIFIATEKIAQGLAVDPIPERGKSVIALHARYINKLRTGIRTSLTEQAKSERLKTELITNVSHDLRTPLTSIITYTDLLKNPKLSEEERAEYVSILERKSNRLKTLIEDLFEVSKMASGNMELKKQKVDLTQLIQQVIGEHQEKIEQSELDFRLTTSEQPVIANVDGQKWWRVLDNLITNAIKYSMEHTRVYVTLKRENNLAEFVIKNVTKYELGDNVDELVERFKRADTSRNTEGSGLGLAIAQSIVDLHGGTMRIELDGDLFKVTVQIETM
ncbi:hypothetical protein BFG57_12740 [Bacillus solimangrovi]|uniref:histidine kinase n=2 Tax=Bacillus solimangrovi TaxID=1305675 RepID=A0A1E5LGS8_9BACI|nr:hypothetical protein BFG57_12740 [Bacillus solimangrovi]